MVYRGHTETSREQRVTRHARRERDALPSAQLNDDGYLAATGGRLS
jgi:hypothetical protein